MYFRETHNVENCKEEEALVGRRKEGAGGGREEGEEGDLLLEETRFNLKTLFNVVVVHTVQLYSTTSLGGNEQEHLPNGMCKGRVVLLP